MQAVNQSVIGFVAEHLSAGRSVWFATILKTYGASPRPEGSLFAFCPDASSAPIVSDSVHSEAMPNRGQTAGSLSGGCIEEDLLVELQSKAPIDRPELKIYGDNAAERSRLSLPCGGSLEILLEFLPANSASIEHFEALNRHLSQHQRVARTTYLDRAEFSFERSEKRPGLIIDEQSMRQIMGAPDRLLILGMGEPARYCLPVLESLDFYVHICEPRADVWEREAALFSAVECHHCLPDDLIREHFLGEDCAVLALAHDPRVDDLGLIAALEGKAFFVGAMGSQKTSVSRRDRLRELGVTKAQLERLSAPIGVDIPSKTPPEIAVSIAAELISARVGRT